MGVACGSITTLVRAGGAGPYVLAAGVKLPTLVEGTDPPTTEITTATLAPAGTPSADITSPQNMFHLFSANRQRLVVSPSVRQ